MYKTLKLLYVVKHAYFITWFNIWRNTYRKYLKCIQKFRRKTWKSCFGYLKILGNKETKWVSGECKMRLSGPNLISGWLFWIRQWTLRLKIIYVTNKMQLLMLFIDNNVVHVSGVSRPSSGARELCVQPMVLTCWSMEWLVAQIYSLRGYE